MSTHCKQTLFITLLVVVGLTACQPESDEGQSLAPGQEPYLRYCASCHGNQGQGRPPSFPPLAGSEWIELAPDGLAAIVLLGLRGEIEVAGERYRGFMPPLKHVDDAQLAAIVNFMTAQWAGSGSELAPADIAELRASLAGRGPLEGREALDGLIGERP